MSVRVRLTRVGSKKNPVWRVVVADQRSPRDGRTIETVGHYNPQTEPSTVVLDRERLDYWIEKGAQPSNSVRKLMRAPNTPAPAAVVDEATAGAAADEAAAPSDVAGATEPDPAGAAADETEAAAAEPEAAAEADTDAAPEPDPDADPPSEGAGDAEAAPDPEVAADPESPDDPDEPPVTEGSGDSEPSA
jgi:small subunit ribosomal protein S16